MPSGKPSGTNHHCPGLAEGHGACKRAPTDHQGKILKVCQHRAPCQYHPEQIVYIHNPQCGKCKTVDKLHFNDARARADAVWEATAALKPTASEAKLEEKSAKEWFKFQGMRERIEAGAASKLPKRNVEPHEDIKIDVGGTGEEAPAPEEARTGFRWSPRLRINPITPVSEPGDQKTPITSTSRSSRSPIARMIFR